MTSGWIVAAVVAIGFAVVMGVQSFTSEGVPSTPTVTLQTTPLTPSTAQVVTLNFQAQVYSQQPPNGIDQLPPRVVYSVWQGQYGGARTTILSNASVALGVLSSAGNLYTLGGSVSVSLPALCTTSGCQASENLTVTATTQVPVWYGLYASATTKAVFSNSPGIGSQTPTVPPSYAVWAFNAFAPIIAIFAVGLLLFAVVTKHPAIVAADLVAWLTLLGAFLAWIVW